MSATQTAKMIDILTREKPLTKTEATEFLDFVEQKVEQKQKADGWLKVLIAGMFALIVCIAGGMLAVFSLLWDLKAHISNMDNRLDNIEKILLQKR